MSAKREARSAKREARSDGIVPPRYGPQDWVRAIHTGDNLNILCGMADGCVDLVYLDPPFNKNRNFAAPIGSKAAGAAFKDTWTLDDVDLTWHGELGEAHPALYQTIDAAGTAHSKGMKAYLIYMAVRLLELRRVMKPTASIYLHCDPTASHYLKTLMDSIFGRDQFRNEIVWCYSTSGRAKKFFAKKHDILFLYTRGKRGFWGNYRIPVSEKYLKSHYRQRDSEGRRCRIRVDAGKRRIYYPEEGMTCNDWWEIPYLNSQAKERVGYPTQKPLALLDRIIRASSNEGDLVLDPFCGCATACVAAERLNRQWIGMDISDMAYKLVKERLTNEVSFMGTVLHDIQYWSAESVTESQAPPKPTSHKHLLYGQQEARCAMCSTFTQFNVMEVDHILPRAEGGGDELENLQLLCGPCNREKGTSEDSEAKANKIVELRERLARLETEQAGTLTDRPGG